MKAGVTLRRLLTRQMALVTGVAAVVLLAGLGQVLQSTYMGQLEDDLRARTRLMARLLAAAGPAGTPPEQVRRLAADAGARLTLIGPNGQVLADSQEDPARMEDHSGRPEVATALAGREGLARHFSRTLGRNMLYAAAPVPGGGPVAVARLALPLDEVRAALLGLGAVLLAIVLSIAAGALWLATRQAASLSRQLEEMTAAARTVAAGDLHHRVYVQGPAELQELAASINHMAAALAEHIGAVSESRDLLDAVLDYLPSGVLCFDRTGALTVANPAARQVLALGAADPGRHHTEVLRSSALQAAVDAALAGRGSGPGPVAVPAGHRVLAATAVPGRAPGVGAVMVLHDVTEARRVEAMRRDLIANVSHELKTPVTAIQGFAETLLAGALDDPADARRFVEIMGQEARRLAALIQDLLDLARLESDPGAVQPGAADLADLARKVVARLLPRAEAAGVTLAAPAPAAVPARVDLRRMDQVVTNLVENSLLVTPPGGSITVRVTVQDRRAVLSVADTGSGIPPADLPRIFERFYRVEKGRSRRTGGTGLGLAIVKHVAEAHGGRVYAESELGRGTTVYVELPL